MYLININPNAANKSILMIPKAESHCCANGDIAILGKYRAKFDTGTIATIDRITINGTTKTFAAAYPTTTQAGRDAILAEIESYMNTLLGTNQGRTVMSVSGTTVRITTDFSEVKFQTIGNGSATAKFAAIETIKVGDKASASAEFALKVVKNGTNYDIYIKPMAGKDITTLTVTYNSVSRFNSSWPKISSYTIPASGSIVDGFLKFTVTNTVAEAAATLAVSITPSGESAVAYSQSVIIADYKI